MAAKISFFAISAIHNTRNLTDLSVSATIRQPLIFVVCLFNTRALCHLLRHRLPASSQIFINSTRREVDRDWSVVFRRTFARTWESVHALPPYKAEGIHECPLLCVKTQLTNHDLPHALCDL